MTRDLTAGIADENLYTGNAFRVTSLATTAGASAVRERRESLTASAVAGGAVAEPVTDPGVFDAAFEVLADPQLRIVHELFWLWGEDTGVCGCDGEIHVLHDRAVLAHAEAIDATVHCAHLPQAWALAASNWQRLVPDPRTWGHLSARARALNEPRLTAPDAAPDVAAVDVVAQLREQTPHLLVVAGVKAALAGNGDESSIQMDKPGWGADRVLVETAVSEATSPIVARLRALLAEARTATEEGGAEQAGLELRDSALPDVVRLAAVAPPARYRRTGELVDQTAIALHNAGFALAERAKRGQGDLAIALLQDALALEPSPPVRMSITASEARIRRVLQANRLLALHGLSVATTDTDDLVARINAARRAGRHDQARELVDALLALIPDDDPGRPALQQIRTDVAGGQHATAPTTMTTLQQRAPTLVIPYALVLGFTLPFLPGWLVIVLAVVGMVGLAAIHFGYLPYSSDPEPRGAPRAPAGLGLRVNSALPRSVAVILGALIVFGLTVDVLFWRAVAAQPGWSDADAVVGAAVGAMTVLVLFGCRLFERRR